MWKRARRRQQPYAARDSPERTGLAAGDYLAFMHMLLGSGTGRHGQMLSADSMRRIIIDRITPAAQKRCLPFFRRFWERDGWGVAAP